MKLWIDDIKSIPEGYIGAKSVKRMSNKKYTRYNFFVKKCF